MTLVRHEQFECIQRSSLKQAAIVCFYPFKWPIMYITLDNIENLLIPKYNGIGGDILNSNVSCTKTYPCTVNTALTGSHVFCLV